MEYVFVRVQVTVCVEVRRQLSGVGSLLLSHEPQVRNLTIRLGQQYLCLLNHFGWSSLVTSLQELKKNPIKAYILTLQPTDMLCMLPQEIDGKLNELTKMPALCLWGITQYFQLYGLGIYLQETSAMSLMYCGKWKLVTNNAVL